MKRLHAVKQAYGKYIPNLLAWKKLDWFAFFIVMPLFLIGVQLLSEQITSSFQWNPQNPTIVSAFMSNYTHASFEHLYGNLLSYIIIMFLLFSIEVKKSTFRRMSLVIFFVFPFLLATVQFFLTPTLKGLGFSGLAAAFLGYLTYAAYNYLKERHIPLKPSFLIFVMLLNFGIMLITWQNVALLEYILLLAVILYFCFDNRQGLAALARLAVREHKKSRKDKVTYLVPALIAIITTLFILSFADIVPQNINQGGGHVVNILVHYIGYTGMILLVAAIEVVKEKKRK